MAERGNRGPSGTENKKHSRGRAYVCFSKRTSAASRCATWLIRGRELRHFTRTTATCTIFSISLRTISCAVRRCRQPPQRPPVGREDVPVSDRSLHTSRASIRTFSTRFTAAAEIRISGQDIQQAQVPVPL